MPFGFMLASSYTKMLKKSTESAYRFEYEYAFKSLQYTEAPEHAEVLITAGFLLGIPIAAVSMGAVYGYLGKIINLVLPATVKRYLD